MEKHLTQIALQDMTSQISGGLSVYGRSPVGKGDISIKVVNTAALGAGGVVDLKGIEPAIVASLDAVKSYLLVNGDVLINIRGTSFRAVVWSEDGDNFVASSNIGVIRLSENSPIGPYLLQAALNSPAGQQALRGVSQGSTILGLRPKMIGSLTLSVPSKTQASLLEQICKQHVIALQQAEIAAKLRKKLVQSITKEFIRI